jgi:hypothetical protein
MRTFFMFVVVLCQEYLFLVFEKKIANWFPMGIHEQMDYVIC